MARTGSLSLALALLGLVLGGGSRAAAQSAETPGFQTPGAEADAKGGLTLLPTLAAAIGPTWGLSSAEEKPGLAVDVTVGAAISWPRRGQELASRDERLLKAALWLQPEFGYSYERGDPAEPRASGHLGSLGLGVGYGSLLFLSGAYTPRLVAGFVGGELAVGLRHGLSGQFLGRLFSAELSHQLLLVGGELRHELRLLLGLNAGALLLPWL